MKITAVFDTSLRAGGAHNQSLSALIQLKRLIVDRFIFSVVVFDKVTVVTMASYGIEATLLEFSLLDKFWSKIFKSFMLFGLIPKKLIDPFEKKLLAIDTDLVYFLGPSLLPFRLVKLNYIFTLFDIAHRDYPEFPEVRMFNEFQKREKLYSKVICESFLTLTDSVSLSKEVERIYRVQSNRLLSMPFGPTPDISLRSMSIEFVRNAYKLPESYFFYPAQLWPHKNHQRIFEALSILRSEGKYFNLVLVGGDKGNFDYLNKRVRALDLSDQVFFLGLVPPNHMKALYQASVAVVMPTYFGPTNLPPLEAWQLGVPLIYSRGMLEQAGEAARLVNPDSSESLVSAMKEVVKNDVRDELVLYGYQRLQEIDLARGKAEQELLMRLVLFELRLKCWKAVE